MRHRTRRAHRFAVCLVGATTLAALSVIAQDAKEKKAAPPTTQESPLPPGWTNEDMEACMLAGTPGKMHERLARSAGTWQGKSQTWMGPVDAESIQGECTQTITPVMDGHYIKCEMTGEVPGMGTFNGLGITGFDNVTQKFVATWIDNQSTGIMNGVGELSKDGKTLTWTFTYNCPIRKKPATVRQVETYPDADTMTFEMFTADPKSGKEYKCMQLDFKRKS